MPTQTRTEYLEEALRIVTESHLSAADKKMLSGRIPFVAEGMVQMFVEVCREDPFGVDVVVKNFKKKLDAQGNLQKLHEIVKQESRDIEELLNSHALI